MPEHGEFVCTECRETFSHGEPVVVAGIPYCSDTCANRADARTEWIKTVFWIGLMIALIAASVIASDRY